MSHRIGRGTTPGGAPVRNVTLPVLSAAMPSTALASRAFLLDDPPSAAQLSGLLVASEAT
jgi:hypothetical protein